MIESIAKNALKALLVSKRNEIVSGLTSGGMPVPVPLVTTSPGTKPVDGRPFIAVNVSGRRIEFDGSPPSIKDSELRVNIILRDNIEPELDDDQTYEISTGNHSDIGDRIVAEIAKKFKNDRVIKDPATGFTFKMKSEEGMDKTNSAGVLELNNQQFYVVEVSEITFTLRSECEETIY